MHQLLNGNHQEVNKTKDSEKQYIYFSQAITCLFLSCAVFNKYTKSIKYYIIYYYNYYYYIGTKYYEIPGVQYN